MSFSTVLGMTLKDPADDPGSWWVDEGLKGKSLFTEPYIFCHDSSEDSYKENWARTGGFGLKK